MKWLIKLETRDNSIKEAPGTIPVSGASFIVELFNIFWMHNIID